MKLIVSKHSIKIKTTSVVNAGAFNVDECTFEFDEAYTGLIKKAVFGRAGKPALTIPILDNRCQVPAEVLRAGEYVTIGVYGYSLDDDGRLVLRYSPVPVRFLVSPGSYCCDAKQLGPKASEYDVYDAKLKQMMDDVDGLMREMQYRIEMGEFNGKDGVPGRSPYIGENGNWFSYNERGEAVDTGIKASPDLSSYATRDEIPTRLPNPEALTVRYNGETAFVYDGSEAKTGDFGAASDVFTDDEWNAMFN